MTQQITITVDDITLRATLNDSAAARQIWDALPITGSASVWGDEIYLDIPVSMDEAADAQAQVDVGALAFWPPGNAFCIFYGPTPVSRGQEPRAYSPVNVFGHIEDDATQLRGTRSGAAVHIEQAP